jgi:hypothetical protein
MGRRAAARAAIRDLICRLHRQIIREVDRVGVIDQLRDPGTLPPLGPSP